MSIKSSVHNINYKTENMYWSFNMTFHEFKNEGNTCMIQTPLLGTYTKSINKFSSILSKEIDVITLK